MLGWLTQSRGPCRALLDSLEHIDHVEVLPASVKEHAASCKNCQDAMNDWVACRALLGQLPRQREESRPWFASQVMAAIAEQESRLERALETWTVLPKLASKLAWVSALALVLTTTWLAARPTSVPVAQVHTDLTGEPVVENHPVPANNDEVLASLTERTE
jgi:hypothetical protein